MRCPETDCRSSARCSSIQASVHSSANMGGTSFDSGPSVMVEPPDQCPVMREPPDPIEGPLHHSGPGRLQQAGGEGCTDDNHWRFLAFAGQLTIECQT